MHLVDIGSPKPLEKGTKQMHKYVVDFNDGFESSALTAEQLAWYLANVVDTADYVIHTIAE